MTHRTISLLALALLAAGGCASSGSGSALLVATTDVHGAYSTSPEGKAGLRPLAAMVDRLRAEGRAVVLVDSGDMWSGTLLSDAHEGAPGVAVYNALGVAAAALGNHEVDYGPVGASRVGDDAFGALEARMAEARYPILAANVHARPGAKDAAGLRFDGHTVVERGGLRIGIVGVVTPVTPQIAFPYVGEALEFEAAEPAVEREAKALREAGVDAVVVLAHIGGACATPALDDASTCEADSELFALVQATPPGLVDVWLGGHTHKRVLARLGGAIVAQGAANAREAAEVTLTREAGGPLVTDARLVPIEATPAEIAASPTAQKVDAILAPLEAEQAAVRGRELGSTLAAPLGRDYDRGSAMGSFVCDALMAVTPGTSACFYNSGGLRADLPAGPITYGGIYDVLPFGNAITTLDLTGAQIAEIVRIGTAGAHGSIQLGGLRVVVDRTRDACPTVDRNHDGHIDTEDRDRVVSLTLADGSPLDPAATYRVVTNSFLASGGDSLGAVTRGLPPERVHTELDRPDREAIAAWLTATPQTFNTPEAPITGERLRYEGEEPVSGCTAP
ncbi:MAG: bifunctional metallophosphatase/5'-nucleotidase [Myxococcales bacterium]|nr:bifunctional metallophosphatase/5'-nucleotidase [Myxococcales bacterium]MCB9735623.1 bifunctional metallophosphatase/5'-nucleotidase [Deltaproteobacteria bacterium]